MTFRRILIAGIGNIFLGDDAFGVEVVRLLSVRPLPPGVELRDFGIRALDVAYALQDGYDAVILVDAVCRGGPAGTLHLLEPAADPVLPAVDPHQLDLARVLKLVRSQGGPRPLIRLVGCEPASFEPATGLTEAVERATEQAVDMVHALIEGLRKCEL